MSMPRSAARQDRRKCKPMKQFSQQFHKKATTTVKLQATEKRELRERLVAYMEYHPLPAEMKPVQKASSVATPVMTDKFALVKIPFHALFKYGTAAAIFVLVIVPFVAEKAVPGDALYAVKVQFNEEIRSSLTFDSLEKVEWETERLNRRIAEARLLASEGRLTEAVEVEVANAVRTHTENAKREIEVLRTEDADEATIASIALDTTLQAQSDSLKADQEANQVVDGVTETLSYPSGLIANAIEESREKKTEAIASSTVPAYEKLIARVEQNTTRIYELRASFGEAVPEVKLAEVDRRIEDIGRAIDAAVALASEDELGSRKALVEVLQKTQRLIVFMTELKVVETVDIESLMPVVPTEEEKQVVIASTTRALEEKQTLIQNLLEGIEDEAVREKAAAGEVTLSDTLLRMASSTDAHETFLTLSLEAHALADDMITLLEQSYTAEELVMIREEMTKDDEKAIPEGEVSSEAATGTIPESEEPIPSEGEVTEEEQEVIDSAE